MNTKWEKFNESQEYIKITKEEPIFVAECDHFGYIETTTYKAAQIGDSLIHPFALDYTEAIINLHKWIKETNSISEFPKAKWNIYVINGTFDKSGERIEKKVYSITVSN